MIWLFVFASDFDAIVSKANEGRSVSYVQSLTDEVGPRLTGSDGAARAVEWGIAAMKAAGLKNVRKEPAKTARWVRGAESGEVLAPYPQVLKLTAIGGSVGGDITGEIVECGDIPSLKALGDKAKGKVVFVNKPFTKYDEVVGIRWHAASDAARLGAIGVLIRSTGSGYHRLPHTGGMKYDHDVTKIPIAAVSPEDAELLHRLPRPTKVRFSLGAKEYPAVDSFNVVGEVVGRERPDEIVLIGAHLDSWDLGTGALDDGAGCGIVLDVGRILLQKPPRRTVRVVLFMNEEFGLDGAYAYAAAHKSELSKHVAALEADSGSAPADGFAIDGDTTLLKAWMAPYPNLPVKREDHGGADLIPLEGVPKLNVDQHGGNYFDWHHTAGDTFDKIDPKGLMHATAATAWLAWMAAEAKETLRR